MANLIAAAIVFILIHRLISGGPARPLLVRALGEKSYRAFFAVLSFAILTWMVIAYARVHPIGTGAPAWSGMSGIGVALCIVQLLAIILVVPGVMAPNHGPGLLAREPHLQRAERHGPPVQRAASRSARPPPLLPSLPLRL